MIRSLLLGFVLVGFIACSTPNQQVPDVDPKPDVEQPAPPVKPDTPPRKGPPPKKVLPKKPAGKVVVAQICAPSLTINEQTIQYRTNPSGASLVDEIPFARQLRVIAHICPLADATEVNAKIDFGGTPLVDGAGELILIVRKRGSLARDVSRFGHDEMRLFLISRDTDGRVRTNEQNTEMMGYTIRPNRGDFNAVFGIRGRAGAEDAEVRISLGGNFRRFVAATR